MWLSFLLPILHPHSPQFSHAQEHTDTYSEMVMEVQRHESQQRGLARLSIYVSFVAFRGMSVKTHCV